MVGWVCLATEVVWLIHPVICVVLYMKVCQCGWFFQFYVFYAWKFVWFVQSYVLFYTWRYAYSSRRMCCFIHKSSLVWLIHSILYYFILEGLSVWLIHSFLCVILYMTVCQYLSPASLVKLWLFRGSNSQHFHWIISWRVTWTSTPSQDWSSTSTNSTFNHSITENSASTITSSGTWARVSI